MGTRRCGWCQEVPLVDVRARFCSQRCRQAAFRLRCRVTTDRAQGRPMRVAYADPPYPGLARYYRDQPTYRGEVDHRELVASLVDRYDGWALSTSSATLRAVLPLCPEQARVCVWAKPNPVPPATFGLHSRWEAVVVVPARTLRPGFPDWLVAQPARSGGTLIGRKPIAFAAWLFRLLGMLPGDSLEDLFPGTGVIGRAWALLSSTAARDTSLAGVNDG